MQLRKIKSWNNVSYFLSVSRNNSKQFCLYFRIFLFSQNDQNSAKQWAVSYSFAFRETKKTNTKLSTLVRIRFANYSKFVYTVLCLLYAVCTMCLLWSRLNQWALPDSGKCAISPYRRLRRQPIPTGTSPSTPATPVKGEDKY